MTRRASFTERLTNLLLGPLTETVIACADAQVDTLVMRGHQRPKVRVIRNGVDTARFSRDDDAGKRLRGELGVPQDGLIVMLAAAHRQEKRQDRFVLLIEQLHSVGVPAWGVMVGGGPLLARNKTLSEASPVSDWLRVAGPIVDMPAAYSAADVVVLVSDDIETFPLSFLEAQACETPVVGMDTGGVRETFVDGLSGFVIPQGDLDDMVSVIARLLKDKDRRTEMGRAGRRFVEDQLSSESTVKGYLAVLSTAGK